MAKCRICGQEALKNHVEQYHKILTEYNKTTSYESKSRAELNKEIKKLAAFINVASFENPMNLGPDKERLEGLKNELASLGESQANENMEAEAMTWWDSLGFSDKQPYLNVKSIYEQEAGSMTAQQLKDLEWVESDHEYGFDNKSFDSLWSEIESQFVGKIYANQGLDEEQEKHYGGAWDGNIMGNSNNTWWGSMMSDNLKTSNPALTLHGNTGGRINWHEAQTDGEKRDELNDINADSIKKGKSHRLREPWEMEREGGESELDDARDSMEQDKFISDYIEKDFKYSKDEHGITDDSNLIGASWQKGQEDVEPVKCNDCGADYDSQYVLDHHKKIEHGEGRGDTYGRREQNLWPEHTDETQCVTCGLGIDSHANPNTDYRGMNGDAPATDHYYLGGDQGGSDDKLYFESKAKEYDLFNDPTYQNAMSDTLGLKSVSSHYKDDGSCMICRDTPSDKREHLRQHYGAYFDQTVAREVNIERGDSSMKIDGQNIIKIWESMSGWYWYAVEDQGSYETIDGDQAHAWYGYVQGMENEWGTWDSNELERAGVWTVPKSNWGWTGKESYASEEEERDEDGMTDMDYMNKVGAMLYGKFGKMSNKDREANGVWFGDAQGMGESYSKEDDPEWVKRTRNNINNSLRGIGMDENLSDEENEKILMDYIDGKVGGKGKIGGSGFGNLLGSGYGESLVSEMYEEGKTVCDYCDNDVGVDQKHGDKDVCDYCVKERIWEQDGYGESFELEGKTYEDEELDYEIGESKELASEVEQDEVSDYLDELRESGVTNMFGAGQYVEDEFGVSREEARAFLSYWMKNYGKEANTGDEQIFEDNDDGTITKIEEDKLERSKDATDWITIKESRAKASEWAYDILNDNMTYRTDLSQDMMKCNHCGVDILNKYYDELGSDVWGDAGEKKAVQHLKEEHGIGESRRASESGGYSCDECGRTFDNPQAQAEHPHNEEEWSKGYEEDLYAGGDGTDWQRDYPINQIDSGYGTESRRKAREGQACPHCDGEGSYDFMSYGRQACNWCNGTGQMSNEEIKDYSDYHNSGSRYSDLSHGDDDGYIDGSDVPTSGIYESHEYTCTECGDKFGDRPEYIDHQNAHKEQS